MVSKVRSTGLMGVGGYEVSVECFLSGGLPAFDIVGLPDAAVKEARERVRAAIKNAGLTFPVSRVTVNLAPADTRKAGTLYDLPVLVCILVSSGVLKQPSEDMAFFGELSLAGELRAVPGALPMALAARRAGVSRLIVPFDNAPEAAFAEGVEVLGVRDVGELISLLRGEAEIAPQVPVWEQARPAAVPDFSEVKGQENVKRALEVAAAGGHNILLSGPPGAGKSMLSKRLPGILPDMTREEIIEVTEIYSVLGLTSREHPIVTERPFRSPHHTVSATAVSGGGSNPKPGEISLAHNGVLFLDEMPEFQRDVLEVLRQPLEDGTVSISRVAGYVTYPSRFMLVCAMNPCKCGWHGHPSGRCRCSAVDVQRYHSRISGPLLDRIDIVVEVPALEYEELKDRAPAENSDAIRARVGAARQIQLERFGGGARSNAHMGRPDILKHCTLDSDCETLMRRAYETLGLTARSHDRILRVARTIADLDSSEEIGRRHLAEAVQYRTYDFRDSENNE